MTHQKCRFFPYVLQRLHTQILIASATPDLNVVHLEKQHLALELKNQYKKIQNPFSVPTNTVFFIDMKTFFHDALWEKTFHIFFSTSIFLLSMSSQDTSFPRDKWNRDQCIYYYTISYSARRTLNHFTSFFLHLSGSNTLLHFAKQGWLCIVKLVEKCKKGSTSFPLISSQTLS